MTVAELIFYLVAVLTVIAALGVVTVPNAVHAALLLIASLLGTATFYILLSSEFLALVQVLIYAGAVATIILFALMLIRPRDIGALTSSQWPLAALAGGVLVVVLLVAVGATDWPRDAGQVTTVSLQTLGDALFRRWAVPFEVASVVLLVALVGAIVIARHESEES